MPRKNPAERAAYNKEYYHRTRIRKGTPMAFTKNPMSPEERKQRKREASLRDYHSNIEKRRASQNARKRANPEKTATQRRGYRTTNLEKYREYGRRDYNLRRQRRPWLNSYNTCRRRAAAAGLEFTLTTTWGAQTYTGRCALTDLEFEVRTVSGKPGPTPRSVSIDRIDQTKGYTPENCRFVLHGVNAFRGTGCDDQMREVLSALTK